MRILAVAITVLCEELDNVIVGLFAFSIEPFPGAHTHLR